MISVIIPCYNVSGTLLQCIQSISRQTYRKFEIILINDGSTDNTVEVIQRIKEEFHELLIKVINQENHGVSSARNQGIKSAVGEYISFVDADDYIEPLFFEELLDGYKSDVELSIVGIQKSIDTNKKSSSNKKVVNNSKYFETMFKDPEIKGFPVNRLYKTNIIKENNVYFNESLSILEDLEFNLRYYQFVDTVSISTAPLYHYIIQDSSAMTGQWNEKK